MPDIPKSRHKRNRISVSKLLIGHDDFFDYQGWADAEPNLPGKTKCVLAGLGYLAEQRNSALICATHQRISDITGASLLTVAKSIDRLVEAKLIVKCRSVPASVYIPLSEEFFRNFRNPPDWTDNSYWDRYCYGRYHYFLLGAFYSNKVPLVGEATNEVLREFHIADDNYVPHCEEVDAAIELGYKIMSEK